MTSAAIGTATAGDGLTHGQTMRIVLGSLVPCFMGSMGQSNVASALPSIGRALGAEGDLSWVITIYLLTSTAATPLYGKLSDIHGRRIVLLGALWIFILGSLGCALAPSMPALVLCRALQGVGAGGISSVPLTILGDIAPPRLRARYYTYFSLVYITAGAVGPAFGGFCAQYANWTLIFWSNLPVCLAGLLITGKSLRLLPRYDRPSPLDWAGAALIVAASALTMFALNVGGKSWPWASTQMIALVIGCLALWLGFVARQRTAPAPLIPLDVVRDPIVRMATAANALGWGSVMTLNISLPVYLQLVHHVSPANAGLALMVFMTTVNISALVGSALTARVEHYKRPGIISMCVCLAATIALAWRTRDMSLMEFQVITGLIGLGFGAVAPITTVAMQNAVALHQLGTASATMSFSRGLFTTFVTAGFGVVIFAAAPADGGAIAPETVAIGFEWAFGGAALLLALSLVALILLEEKPLAQAHPGRA